jgi:hypothetical protein
MNGYKPTERQMLVLARREARLKLDPPEEGKLYVMTDAGTSDFISSRGVNIVRVVKVTKKLTEYQRLTRISYGVRFGEISEGYTEQVETMRRVFIPVDSFEIGEAWLRDLLAARGTGELRQAVADAQAALREAEEEAYRDILSAIPGYPTGRELAE